MIKILITSKKAFSLAMADFSQRESIKATNLRSE